MSANPAYPIDDPASLGVVMPVIVIHELETAVPLARALVAGGLRALEITLRTPHALEAMKRIAAEVSDAMVGAGTLRSPADAARVAQAGARFALSPGFSKELSEACADVGLPFVPGVSTASEAMAALNAGHRLQKFFPAVAAGGIAMIKALQGPFPELRFCPTGGITAATAADFLALPNVPICGGTWLTPAALVANHDWAAIEALARQAAALSGKA
jgi:2-dehydro-3-deoxyphosphogluconate aldolase/(4S)-4-hydroxy-2-oxoglutarate aldolase